jgi:hypothetical protein
MSEQLKIQLVILNITKNLDYHSTIRFMKCNRRLWKVLAPLVWYHRPDNRTKYINYTDIIPQLVDRAIQFKDNQILDRYMTLDYFNQKKLKQLKFKLIHRDCWNKINITWSNYPVTEEVNTELTVLDAPQYVEWVKTIRSPQREIDYANRNGQSKIVEWGLNNGYSVKYSESNARVIHMLWKRGIRYPGWKNNIDLSNCSYLTTWIEINDLSVTQPIEMQFLFEWEYDWCVKNIDRFIRKFPLFMMSNIYGFEHVARLHKHGLIDWNDKIPWLKDFRKLKFIVKHIGPNRIKCVIKNGNTNLLLLYVSQWGIYNKEVHQLIADQYVDIRVIYNCDRWLSNHKITVKCRNSADYSILIPLIMCEWH